MDRTQRILQDDMNMLTHENHQWSQFQHYLRLVSGHLDAMLYSRYRPDLFATEYIFYTPESDTRYIFISNLDWPEITRDIQDQLPELFI